jgi:hypothetical protein
MLSPSVFMKAEIYLPSSATKAQQQAQLALLSLFEWLGYMQLGKYKH